MALCKYRCTDMAIVTERARKLRAQYAMQAQGMRTRLEIRIHRIPAALRKANIAELLQKYAQEEQASMGSRPANVGHKRNRWVPLRHSHTSSKRSCSASISGDAEQDNSTVHNPKKRMRTIGIDIADTSQLPAATNVLSPRSDNARPPHQSSLRLTQTSPTKSHLARPQMSPLKSALPSLAPTVKPSENGLPKRTTKQTGSRAVSKQASNPTGTTKPATTTARPKRVAPNASPAQRAALSAAEDSVKTRLSDASDGTTIVIKTESKIKKGGLVGRIAGMGTKAKKTAPAAATTKVQAEVENGIVKGGRVLRKRA